MKKSMRKQGTKLSLLILSSLSERSLGLRKKYDPEAILALFLLKSMKLFQFIVMKFWQVYDSDRREQLDSLLWFIQIANEVLDFISLRKSMDKVLLLFSFPPAAGFVEISNFCKGFLLCPAYSHQSRGIERMSKITGL